MLRKTEKYKFLGNYVNEKGNMEDQINFMESKVPGVIRECNKMCCSRKVGKDEVEANKLVYKAQIIPAIFFNLEGWTNIGKSDWERLDAIQGKILRGILGVPQSTPYWGMLHELDIIPVKLLLTYKRMMVYHNIINSDEERIVRTITTRTRKVWPQRMLGWKCQRRM